MRYKFSNTRSRALETLRYHVIRRYDRILKAETRSWVSWQIRKIASFTCAWNAGNVSPPPWVSDPNMHHGKCVTHVSWYMSWSLTSGFLLSRLRGNISGIAGAFATRNFTYLARGPLTTLGNGQNIVILQASLSNGLPGGNVSSMQLSFKLYSHIS